MNVMLAGFLGGWEWIIVILAVVLLLFGAKRIPELAKGLGSGIKEFKKAAREVTEEVQNAGNRHAARTSPPPTASHPRRSPSRNPPNPPEA